MLSKAKIKYIHSLKLKKNRTAEGVFVAEGPKVVGDLMVLATPKIIIATSNWLATTNYKSLTELTAKGHTEIIEVTDDELRKVSFLQNPQQVLAVFPTNLNSSDNINDITNKEYLERNLVIALDGVQDPGNLGTIIRIADWFGIENIICSNETADVWNPKVIQSTMGSIARVRVTYCDLSKYLSDVTGTIQVFGTFLDGESIYATPLPLNGIIIMGNEGNGISEEIEKHVTKKLLIPNFPSGRQTADSLNVAIATAITCSEFRRQTM